MARYLLLVLIGLLVGCEGGTNDQDSTAAERFSVATVRSSDLTYIPVNDKFNSWLITQVGDSLQIMLKAKDQLGQFSDPARWALAIRTAPRPVGVMYANQLDVLLFTNYREDQTKCCVNTLPFSAFDLADQSFVAVGGYVDFTSDRKGVFDLNFQQERSVGSRDFTGPIVNVRGCWTIAGGGGASGCEVQ